MGIHASSKTTKDSTSIWSVSFIILIIINVFDGMNYTGMRSVIANYSIDIGLTETLAGVISGALAVSAFFSRPIAGKLLAQRNNKHILIIALAAITCTIPFYLLCNSFALLMTVRIINGVFHGITGTALMAIAGTLLPDDKIGTGIGIFGLGTILALALGPTVAVQLYKYGATALFLGCTVFALLAFLLSFFIPASETQAMSALNLSVAKQPHNKLSAFFEKEALLPSALTFFAQMTYASIGTFIAYYVGTVKGFSGLSWFYIIWSATLFIGRPAMGKLFDKKGLTPIVIVTSIPFAISFILLAFAQSIWPILFASMLAAFGFGGSVAAYQSSSLANCPPERRGAASSTYFMGTDLGGFIGASVAGSIASAFGYSNMYLASILPLIVSVVLYFVILIIRTKRKNINRKAL